MKAVKFTGKEFLDASGNVVAPEFGDRDQIALLRAYESQFPDPIVNEDGDVEEIDSTPIEVDINFSRAYEYDFKCTCGDYVGGDGSFEDWDDESDVKEGLDGDTVRCDSCKSEYQISYENRKLTAFKISKS